MTDREAVQRFTALYDAHHRQIYAYAMRRGDRQVADEIVSDTFMVAWRRLDDVPRSPLPWLLGVARNLIHEQFRRSARQASAEEELRASMEWTDAADPADVVTDRENVLLALAQLDDEDRELLTLIAWHGLTAAEAAEVIGCTTVTCSVRLHRARRRLDQAMKNQADVAMPRKIYPVKTYVKDAV